MQQVSVYKTFEGQQLRFRHDSAVLNCEMHFSVYLPPAAADRPVPVIYWLSGLTCTDENFVQKAGAQQYASQHQVALIVPDTSPRGEQVPDDPDGAWDFGLGAGFYLDAVCEPWTRHYHMYTYITQELPALVEQHLPVTRDRSIMGHSMGGHGALTIALKNPDSYASVSAFSPICAPTQCPWGQKALGRYLGENRASWAEYDTCALINRGAKALPLLVDQGSADNFLKEQLMPHMLQQTCDASQYPLNYHLRDGYDHSYFFIATFIGEHIAFHASHLTR